MKEIGQVVSLTKEEEQDLHVSFHKAIQDSNFLRYVKTLHLSEDVLMKYTSRLQDSYQEFLHCSNCPGLPACQNKEKGFLLKPEAVDQTVVFSYQACPYYQKRLMDTAYQKNIYLFEVPKRMKEASMKSLYRDDSNRKEIIKYMVSFIKNYLAHKEGKGMYLYGNFGSGKTYMVVALLNELAKHNIASAVIYYPEFLRSLKESFGEDYKEKYHTVRTVPLLLLDDIGAENVTAWNRDEVLGPILQYRMDEGLPTFLTSNFTLEQLENHLAMSRQSIDQVKARRIIERIQELCVCYSLVSKNRRGK